MPKKFKCPHGEHNAYYYGGSVAGCPIHGRLLYIDIPKEIRKPIAWKTIRSISLEKSFRKALHATLSHLLGTHSN